MIALEEHHRGSNMISQLCAETNAAKDFVCIASGFFVFSAISLIKLVECKAGQQRNEGENEDL